MCEVGERRKCDAAGRTSARPSDVPAAVHTEDEIARDLPPAERAELAVDARRPTLAVTPMGMRRTRAAEVPGNALVVRFVAGNLNAAHGAIPEKLAGLRSAGPQHHPTACLKTRPNSRLVQGYSPYGVQSWDRHGNNFRRAKAIPLSFCEYRDRHQVTHFAASWTTQSSKRFTKKPLRRSPFWDFALKSLWDFLPKSILDSPARRPRAGGDAKKILQPCYRPDAARGMRGPQIVQPALHPHTLTPVRIFTSKSFFRFGFSSLSVLLEILRTLALFSGLRKTSRSKPAMFVT